MIPCTAEVLKDPDGIGGWVSEERAAQPCCLLEVSGKSVIRVAPNVKGTCMNCQVIIKYSAPSWQYIFEFSGRETGLDANEQAKAHLVTTVE